MENNEAVYGTVTDNSENFIKYPCFVDSAKGIFELADSSYCINAGIEDTSGMNLPHDDILSNSRIKTGRIDIGAYEFIGTPANRLPVIAKRSLEYIRTSDSLKLKVQFNELDLLDSDSVIIKSLNSKVKVTPSVGDTTGSMFTFIPDKNWVGNALIAVTVLDQTGKISAINTDTFQISIGDLWGIISIDSTLKDTVSICGNVTLEKGITLTILPGAVLNFTGNYNINALGSILAKGTKIDSIKFTVPDTIKNTGWNGIIFTRETITKDSSEFEYCTFEYARSIDRSAVISLYNITNVLINHCTFLNNIAYNKEKNDFGGAISSYSSNLIITNCYFKKNEVKNSPGKYYINNGGAIYSFLGHPVIANNIFIENTSGSWGGAIYAERCTSFIINNTFYNNISGSGGAVFIDYEATCILKNNIFWKNSNQQIFVSSYGGHAYIENCVVQDGISGISGLTNSFLNNYQIYPSFRDSSLKDFSMSDSSVCLNHGTTDTAGLCLPKDDYLGNPRIINGVVDIGAIEYTKKISFGLNPFGGKGRSGAVSFVYNNLLYLGLGGDKNGVMNDFWRYNPVKKIWSEIDSLPGLPRSEAISFVIGNKAYVGLGRSNYPFNYYKDFYEFDPTTEKWKRIEDFAGTARYNAVTFTIGDTAYIGTGRDTTGEQKDFWKFDPVTSWTRIADLNEKRTGASAFSYNNKGYVTGGTYFDSYSVQLSDIQEYDPVANSWTERIYADGMNLSVNDASAVSLGNKVFICYGNKDAVISYNPETNEVENLGDILGIGRYRFDPVNFILNDTIYFGLGDSGIFNPVYKNDILRMDLPVHFNPTDLLLSNSSIGENSTIGTVIGIFQTVDKNIADTFQYKLVSGEGDSENWAFSILEDKLLINSETDFENRSKYSIRVNTTDPAGLYFEKVFEIKVSDENDAPDDIYLSGGSIDENSAAQIVVGTLSSSDEDAGEVFTYSLVDGEGSDDNLYLHVLENQLVLDSVLNYESKPQLSIRIRSTDEGGLTYETTFLINVRNLNEAPVDFHLSDNLVNINAAIGTVIGVFTTIDPDQEDTSFIYSFVHEDLTNDSTYFKISGDSLLVASTLVERNYQFWVKTFDKGGLSRLKTFTIIANDTSTGTKVQNLTSVFGLYPNPFENYLTIAVNNNMPVDELYLVNISGKKFIPEYKVSGDKYIINTTDIKPGIYNLVIIQKNKMYYEKIIKR